MTCVLEQKLKANKLNTYQDTLTVLVSPYQGVIPSKTLSVCAADQAPLMSKSSRPEVFRKKLLLKIS